MPLFRSVRSRITMVTTLIVAATLMVAGVGLLVFTRRALVSDVRRALTANLVEAQQELNNGVVAELGLLSLGVTVDPFEITGDIVEGTCSPILAEAYGSRNRQMNEFLTLGSLDEDTIAAYEACIAQSDPMVQSVGHCEQVAVDAVGDPYVTFEEFRAIVASEEFDAAYDECLAGSLLIDERVAEAALACNRVVAAAFDGVDVMNQAAVENRIDAALFSYSACMRANGVPDYPDLTFLGAGAEGPSVLAGLAGATVVLPSLESVRSSVDTFGTVIALVVPTLVLGLALLTWVVVGRSLQPVEAIRSRVAEISAEALDQRVPDPGTDDEIGSLATTMNRMLERLEKSAERQRRFVSDASHELRSPLASIRAQIEVALTHPGLLDWTGVGTGVLQESRRMERLVDDLLALARADEGVLISRTEEVNLEDLVVSEAGRVDELEVDLSAVTQASARGDPLALRRVVRNLVDNAARHANSRLSFEVQRDRREVRMVVEDDGSGIPEEDRERVFERFTRLEDGRARDVGGAGLGLAVVRETVKAHGGSVSVETGSSGGARLVVRLPAALQRRTRRGTRDKAEDRD
jgi:signal transduction histidine kinase